MTAEDYGLARRMWHQLEPVHAVFWYAPEVSLRRPPWGTRSRPGGRLLRVAAGSAGRSGPAAGRLSLLQLQPGTWWRPRAGRVGSGPAAADPGGGRAAVDRMYRALLGLTGSTTQFTSDDCRCCGGSRQEFVGPAGSGGLGAG